MSATYNSSLIATSIRDYARAQFRDVAGLSGTVVSQPLLTDEEYDGFVSRFGAQEGLAKLAEGLAAVYEQKIDKYAESGGISVEWPERGDFYLKLAASIRRYGIGDAGGLGNGASTRGGSPDTPTYCTDTRLIMDRVLPCDCIVTL